LLLGLVLADHVLVQELLDLVGGGEAGLVGASLHPAVVRDDVVADVDALVADEDGGARDQLADVVLVLVAERATENFVVPALFHRSRRLMTWSTIPYAFACSASMMKSRSASLTSLYRGCLVWKAMGCFIWSFIC